MPARQEMMKKVTLLCTLLLPMLLPLSRVDAAGLKVKSTWETARTPSFFGYNFHSEISDEALAWLEYAGGNSSRIWSSCLSLYPTAEEPISLWTFISRRHDIVDDLRDHPEDFALGNAQRYVDWASVRSQYETCGGGIERLLDGLDAMGQQPVVLIPSNTGALNSHLSGPPADPNQPTGVYWFNRWFVWQHYFVQAYYLAREHEVTMFEFVNEPDPPAASSLTSEQTIERQMLAGDAIQRAFDTVNQWRATQSLPALTPTIMSAAYLNPLFTCGGCSYIPSVIAKRVVDKFYGYDPSVAWAFPTSFNAYSYHDYVYNEPTVHLSPEYHNVVAGLDTATSPTTLPVFMTETNLRTGNSADNHNWTETTLDSTRLAIYMADLLHEINTAGDVKPRPTGGQLSSARRALTGAYVFQFTERKHAFFWGSNGKVGGSKRAGDVVKLYAEGFAGSRQRMQFEGTSDWLDPMVAKYSTQDHALPPLNSYAGPATGLFTFDASWRSDKTCSLLGRQYVIMSTNHHCFRPTGTTDQSGTQCDVGEADAQTLTIDLSAWPIEPGTPVLVKEVSSGRRAEVRRFYTVDANKKVSFVQPAQSVELMTIPFYGAVSIPTVQTVRDQVIDAYVRGGNQRGNNFGYGPNLYAYANTSDASNRRVAFIKIGLPSGISATSVDKAVLKLTARSGVSETSGSGAAVATVYGIDNDAWLEDSIDWNSAPNLFTATANLGSVTEIGDNFVQDVGLDAHPLGVITGNSSAPTEERIDVSNYIRSQTDGVATFMVIREVRHPGDTDEANQKLWIASREHPNTDYRPALEIVQYPCTP